MRSRYMSSSAGAVTVPAASNRACSEAPANARSVGSTRGSVAIPALTAVRVGVFAGRAAKHGPEVVDEMRLVIPAQTDRQVGEVDLRMALDLQRRLLQPVPAQHPLHGHPHI